jgi:flap endonuclease-1
MGIKGLLKLLISNAPESIEEHDIRNFMGRIIAIDASMFVYQFLIAVRQDGPNGQLRNKDGQVTSHLSGMMYRTTCMRENGIKPIYVFDGKPPDLKKKVLDLRRNVRKKAEEKMSNAETEEEKIKYFKRSVSISKKQLDECRELLDLMGVPYVNAPQEADSQCAWLAENNYVDAVLTEDMDILTFGSPKIVRNLTSQKKKPLEISLDKIKEKFGWSHDNFIEMCVLLGCDYSDHITDINFLKLFHEFQKEKDIDIVLERIKRKISNYKFAMSYFKYPEIDKDVGSLSYDPKDLELLENKLVNDYGFIKYKIRKKLIILKEYNR